MTDNNIVSELKLFFVGGNFLSAPQNNDYFRPWGQLSKHSDAHSFVIRAPLGSQRFCTLQPQPRHSKGDSVCELKLIPLLNGLRNSIYSSNSSSFCFFCLFFKYSTFSYADIHGGDYEIRVNTTGWSNVILSAPSWRLRLNIKPLFLCQRQTAPLASKSEKSTASRLQDQKRLNWTWELSFSNLYYKFIETERMALGDAGGLVSCLVWHLIEKPVEGDVKIIVHH